ncbi:MAG: DUF697 domain-containing protein [Candidatus Hatepunaea meridiana]|nr:DUF697 domain-containing protein [Candidatus Hatepunaea meridiana]
MEEKIEKSEKKRFDYIRKLKTSSLNILKGNYVGERQAVADKIVQNRVWWSVGGGLIPIPWVDLVAVTGVQLSMIYALSKNYDVEFKKNQARTIVASLLGSIVPSSLARGTVGSSLKAIPVLGATLGGISMSAFSGAATYAIGKVFIQHFETGGTFMDLDVEKMREFFKEQFEEGKVEAEKIDKEELAPKKDNVKPKPTPVKKTE